MYCIKHQLHINSPAEEVFKALTSLEGLRQWWTHQTEGSTDLGGLIDFRFGDRYFIQMKVVDMQLDRLLVWECVQAEPDWIGTELRFRLSRNEGKTLMQFEHDKWPTHEDFFAHCNFSWAKYFISLRNYLENGEGQPFQSSQIKIQNS